MSETDTTTARNDGTLFEAGDRAGVRFERRLAHSPERVWAALTEPELLDGWFPARVEGSFEVGAELRFPFPKGEAPTETGTVTECDRPRLLAYTWGAQLLRFELEPDGEGTRLRVSHELPREETAKVAAGWEVKFDELAAVLDGGPRPEFPEEFWTVLHERYAAEFGVDPEVGRRALEEVKRARAEPEAAETDV